VDINTGCPIDMVFKKVRGESHSHGVGYCLIPMGPDIDLTWGSLIPMGLNNICLVSLIAMGSYVGQSRSHGVRFCLILRGAVSFPWG
jgi:hypothetical protein